MSNAKLCATLVGGKGFIGSHLQHALLEDNWDVFVAEKNDTRLFSEDLGYVFYCAGLTADFRQRPFDTVDAHVHYLSRILQSSAFKTLIYLSSTRVYSGALSTEENSALSVTSSKPDDLYNLSKLMGESLCLQSGRDVRVIRLSNVYGNEMSEHNFLSQIISSAKTHGRVTFQSNLDSEKDYISIRDVVHLLPKIAQYGKNEIYNLASGKNVSHAQLAQALTQLGVHCEVDADAISHKFVSINTEKLQTQFGRAQINLIEEFPSLFNYGGS